MVDGIFNINSIAKLMGLYKLQVFICLFNVLTTGLMSKLQDCRFSIEIFCID